MRTRSLSVAVLLSTLVVVSHLNAQTVDSSYSFYPLHVGDMWEYHWQNYIGNPPSHLYYQKTEVLSDTTMQDGSKYFVVQVTNLDTRASSLAFQRVDSTDGYVHIWVDSAYELKTCIYLRSEFTYPDTILNVTTQSRNTGCVDAGCRLAYGFGIVAQQDYGAGWPYRSTIIFARVNGTAHGIPLSVISSPSRPDEFQLYQNYPNPFNPTTSIRFSVPSRSRVRLTIFNILGQQVSELANEELGAGNFERFWNANVASGLYFYRLEAVSISNPSKRFVDVKKMILLR